MSDSRKNVFHLVLATAAAALAGAGLSACHDASEPARPTPIAAAPAAGMVAAVPAQELPEEPIHDPCDGKVCGDACRLCPPDSETCVEPLRHCDARGMCSHVPPACMTE